LLRTYRERDAKGYLVESLWKFLIYSEIAREAALFANARPTGPSKEEQALVAMLNSKDSVLAGDFAVRLERTLATLIELNQGATIEETRMAISEALHGNLLSELRHVLGEALATRERVAVLIDNLDKAWVKNEDIDYLSELILGLLGVADKITQDFAKSNPRRKSVNLTLAVFLRSDIFHFVLRAAQEPDKLSFAKLSWQNHEDLLHVLNQRLAASQISRSATDDIWRKFFVPSVKGIRFKNISFHEPYDALVILFILCERHLR
jgi:hypothetical protein